MLHGAAPILNILPILFTSSEIRSPRRDSAYSPWPAASGHPVTPVVSVFTIPRPV